jgi:2-enoate reductase
MQDKLSVDNSNVIFAADVYGREGSLAENVAAIGGGEIGVETGMHLAEKGHRVTLLEMQDRLAPEATPVHYYTMFMEAADKQKNFKYILNTRCTGIDKDKVTYVDGERAKHEIKAGNVVIAIGMKLGIDRVMKLSTAGNTFYMIGD